MNTYDIHSSTELMQNYLPSETMAPEKQIRAVESSTGTAILFSIDTEDFLRATAESHGDRHGWQRFNLSSKTHPEGFAEGDAACINFEVARCAEGTLRVAMVLKDKKDSKANDVLYLASISPGTETAWFNSPAWVRYEYDDTDNKRSPVKIVNVFLSDATDGLYTVVDVRSAADSSNIFRYNIDADRKPGDPAWVPHDLAIEIQADNYSSCLGRKGGKDVDGIYTSGHEGNNAQILYTPLHGSKRRKPSSVFLQLPANLKPDATATCRYRDNTSDLYNTSDLFVAAAGGLYYFASDNQHEDATAFEIMSGDKRLNKVKSLFAAVNNETVIVWEHNEDKEFFYTSCPVGQITAKPSAWSIPLPIMSGVQQVTPFLNRKHSANTFFAHTTGNQLKIAVKAPGKKSTWSVREILLPQLEKTKQRAKSFSSYTTRLRVTGPDSQPAVGKSVSISSPDAVTSVYINHLYYVVGREPIHVPADSAGSVTIVEAVTRLDGTKFKVSVDGDAVKDPFLINPMMDSRRVRDQLQKLRTEAGLRGARIHYQNEKVKPSRNLLKHGAQTSDVTTAVRNIDNLWKTYDHLNTGKPVNNAALMSSAERSPEYQALVKGGIPVAVDGGDLLSMLETKHAHHVTMVGASASGWWLWDAIVDFFEGVWNLVVKIGEELFTFVFETLEQIFAAFSFVVTGALVMAEDMTDYAKYLFDYEDIKRTKDVMKNLLVRGFEHQLAGLQAFKKDVDGKFIDLEKMVDDWAKLDRDVKMGDKGKLAVSSSTAPLPTQGGPDWLLVHHFEANIEGAHSENAPELPEPPASSFAVLTNALQTEMKSAEELFTELKKLADKAHTLQFEDLMKQFAGLVAHFGLETLKIVFDAFMDIVYVLAKAALEMLNYEIYIPVVSDILEEFGVPRFSLLDVICFIGAVPTTVAFKLLGQPPPFPDNPDTTFLIGATDFQSVLNKFSGAQPTRNVAALENFQPSTSANTTITFYPIRTNAFLALRFLSGFFGTVGTFAGPVDSLNPVVAIEGTPEVDRAGVVNVVSNLMGTGFQFLSGFCWPPSEDANNPWVSNEKISFRWFSGLRWLAILTMNKPLRVLFFRKSPNHDAVALSKGVLTLVDMVFGLFTGGYAIASLNYLYSKEPSPLHELAELEEWSNICSSFSRLSRLGTIYMTALSAVPNPDPTIQLIRVNLAGLYTILQGSYAGLQLTIFAKMIELRNKAGAH